MLGIIFLVKDITVKANHFHTCVCEPTEQLSLVLPEQRVHQSRLPQDPHCVTLRSMTSIRPFQCDDMFKFNHINLDPLTETYNLPFYLQYLATWPAFCSVIEDPSGRLMGYVLGKAEGIGELWHGHVTAGMNMTRTVVWTVIACEWLIMS